MDGTGVMEQILKNNTPQNHIIEVTLVTRGESMTFLQHLNNLVHLELSGINLHGKLSALRYMQRGFLSLKLRQCCLDDADLAQLIGTCHQSTLLQLDLCHDEFQYDEKSSNLIKLCKSLNNVLHLCIVDCGIESWPSNVSVSVILINNSNQLYKEVFLSIHRQSRSL